MSRRRVTRAEVLRNLEVSFEAARAVLVAKNADYGSDADALANFRGAAAADVSAPQAVFSRLNDKIHRLGRAAAGKLRHRDDDVLDAINFIVLLDAALRERKSR